MKTILNLNNLIGVDLTAYGIQRYKEVIGEPPLYSADGLVYLPGWKVFNLFGDMLWHGNIHLPFSMNIVVSPSAEMDIEND